MANDVISFIATIPAGTTFPATHTVSMNVGTVEVTDIRWRVPPGPRGNLSWFLAQSGVQVFPNQNGTSIVADDEYAVWTLDDFPDNPVWELIGSNSGVYDHAVYLEFYTQPYTQPGAPATVDFLSGFPFSDPQVANMWVGGPAPAV
jgi:hypothetical protein